VDLGNYRPFPSLPRVLLPAQLQALQATHGNQFVLRLVGQETKEYDPAAAERLFNEGEGFSKAGEHEKAIVLWERVRQMPGLPEGVANPLVFNIGLSNLKLKRYATAIKYLEDYLAVPGGTRMADAAQLLSEGKRGAGIPTDEQTSKEYEPAAAEHMFVEGERFFRAGEYAKAIVLWERVRQLPGLPASVPAPLVFSMGVANLRLKRYATAIKYFEDYLAVPGTRMDDAAEMLTEAKRAAGIPTDEQTSRP
jgi:tetratricopeptide (TPR) repeat protein